MDNTELLEKYRQTMQACGRVMRRHRAVVDTVVGNTGLHKSTHMMLFYLYHCKTSPSQNDIAARFDISAAAVTTTLKKLEHDGFITRKMSESDSRVRYVELTDKGREVIENTRRAFDRVDEMCLSGFSEDEIAQFAAMIERIKNNLTSIAEENQ